jgi:predicted negative regulator of RcsB-dependent stress response
VAIYDTEEEQLEQLKKWWEANNTSVLTGIIGAIVLLAGINFWQKYQHDVRSQASQLFQELLDNEAKNNFDSVEKISEKIVAEHGSTTYAEFAVLQEVKAKVEKGDLEAAKTLLQKELNNIDSPVLKHVCRLRLVQLLLAAKDYEPALKLIAEVDPATTEGFSANYDELQGDIYVALDRLDEARTAYQSALRTGQATPLVQFKLDDLAAPALNENPVK